MKNIRKNIKTFTVIVSSLILIVLTGCNNWIDVEPENDLTQDEFWKTSEDIMAVVAATYDAMRSTTEKSLLLGEIRADFMSVGPGSFDEYVSIADNDISATNGKAKWEEFYRVINMANTVMYFTPKVQEQDKTLTDEMASQIEAEMVYLRSLCYYYLVRIWKDVPLVMEATISDEVDFFIPKSTEAEVLSAVTEDLKGVINQATNDAESKGRANKFAIQALLADIYLWQENYSQCIYYCDAVSNSGKFGLESNTDWFNIYYPGNSMVESIFELQYSSFREGQHNPFYDINGLLENISIATSRIGYHPVNDIRYCQGNGPIWKFYGFDETGDFVRVSQDGNYIYHRYADIILMKAEALAETGNFDGANNLVQRIAERAGISYIPAYDINNFRTGLLAERGREFAAEGKRWFDILRIAKKNKFQRQDIIMDMLLAKVLDPQDRAIMRTKVLDTMSYYMPIHFEEIDANKNLVQNPFYTR